jgi:hypothetical protein
MSQQAPKHCC